MGIGARYGAATCAISEALGNSGKQAVVEADPLVWQAITDNVRRNNCNANVWLGALSKKPMKKKKTKNGTDYTTVVAPATETEKADKDASLCGENIPIISVRGLEARYGLKIDTLVIDCEGCFDPILRESPEILDNVKLILMEADYGKDMQRMGFADYPWIRKALQDKGFKLVLNEVNQDYPFSGKGRIEYYIFKRESTRRLHEDA